MVSEPALADLPSPWSGLESSTLILMAPLPAIIVAGVFGAAIVLAFVLDAVKVTLCRRLAVA